ncbi:MAG: PRC-barrel domain-containing protein [Actinomycetota bacterium]|nr:PRC-barrel domain-containing protein [Actinomycetota bacterium]
MEQDLWTYRSEASRPGSTLTGVAPDVDLVGFSVEATDGGIGKIDEASYDVGASYLVVDTGPWIFGKKVLLPAGLIRDVDVDAETVFVNRTRDEIKDAPEFDPETYRSDAYRAQIGGYYTGLSTYTPPETSTSTYGDERSGL